MEDLESLAGRVAAVLVDYPIAFSYVFGSRARGTGRGDSDLDVAVHFEPGLTAEKRFSMVLDIGVELARELGCEVDVIDLQDASLRLAGRILTERVVVTGLERPERVRYETELFPRYVDFEHHARKLDAEILAAMAAGGR